MFHADRSVDGDAADDGDPCRTGNGDGAVAAELEPGDGAGATGRTAGTGSRPRSRGPIGGGNDADESRRQNAPVRRIRTGGHLRTYGPWSKYAPRPRDRKIR